MHVNSTQFTTLPVKNPGTIYITGYWFKRPGTASLLILKRNCKRMITSFEVIKRRIFVSTAKIKDIYSEKRNSPLDNLFHLSYSYPILNLITILIRPIPLLATTLTVICGSRLLPSNTIKQIRYRYNK